MPPRKSTDFGALFDSLMEDLRIQIAASVDRTLSDFNKRLSRIERRLDQVDPQNADAATDKNGRVCSLCERTAVARGLCSAHYQQWRYRERKTRLSRRHNLDLGATVVLPPSSKSTELSVNN
ncbi:MAG: hypothetical protein HY903_07210 [Deltaproteobacteria bacterium]|nr:hypothetical protein [Deltaproteobacteria bacterium]